MSNAAGKSLDIIKMIDKISKSSDAGDKMLVMYELGLIFKYLLDFEPIDLELASLDEQSWQFMLVETLKLFGRMQELINTGQQV